MASKFVEFSIYGKLYFLWILCIVKLSKATFLRLTCLEGWVLSGTMCYRLYGQDTLTSSTWDNACRVCKGNGAEMVTVDDYFTDQNVGDFASARNTNKFWTGMSEKGVTSRNGIAMTWNMNVAASIYQGRWSVRNPDTAYGDCVYVERKDGEYVWTVGSCLMKMAFVCQRTSCLPQSFHCDNGRCVNSNWRCDGVDDCGDFSDEVDCAGRCSYLLETATSGRVQSPNYPSNYLPSIVCTWTIVGPEGSNIYLEFLSFNTEKDTDIVEVLIGGRTESTARSVAHLSGQPSLSTARYRSYNNYMIIRFSTDSQTEKVGFSATYSSSQHSYPKELYMTARTTVSTLEPLLFSSQGSNAYLGNRDYVWIIRAEERWKIVTIERMKIDLMGDDVIEIRDGDSGSAPLLEKYTASNNDNVDLPLSQSEPIMGKRFVFSTSNVMYVIMRTSDSTSGTGFSFQYKQGCIARYTADAGEITSPGYPNVNYANFQTCTWTIDIPSGKGVNVMLDRSKDFEIADNEDFIQIYTNSADDSGNAAHGSGAGFTTISLSNDQPFHSTNGKMFIRFKSTAITNKKGFRLLYSVDCPDPGLTEASELNPSQTAGQLRQFDNEFTVSCKNGYSFHSDELNLRTARMKCMYGGKWLVEQRTRTIPQCKPNYCGEPVAVENGYISHSSGVVFGSFVTFTCFPGFNLLGSANITCQSTQWTSRPQCVSPKCPAPPSISNGQLSSTNNQYAAVVNYTCNAGYQLIGAPILFCQSSGQWTASAPQCIKVTCPIPGIKNARVSSSNLPKFQETLTVSCDVGYIVNGSATISCGEDRSFDAVPNCSAEGCFNESLRPTSNAVRSCDWVGRDVTCTYVCKGGHVYYDGTTSKQYNCSVANKWYPTANPEDCLLYEAPSYKAKFEVQYVTADTLASNCRVGFENMLVAYNTTIAKAIDDRCKDLSPGKFAIRSFSSTTLSFKITTVIRGEFIGDGLNSARGTCINVITHTSPSFILPVSSVTCSGNQQANFTVVDIGNSDAGNKCSDNMVLVNSQYCVKCPPGRYFNGFNCVMCAEVQYQNLTGQSSCKSCDENTVSSVDRTTCIDHSNISICTPGYTGEDCSVMTEINECDAEPCMHGGNCTDRVNDFQCTCPEGWTGKQCEMIYDECTVNNKCPSSAQCLNIFNKSYCKCPKGTYGEVCENSPDICRDLRPCLNSATCTAGVNELSKCTCPNDDYRGVGCETMVNHCGDPNKCENGGTCVNLAPGFRCDCPPGYSGVNCSINVNDCSNNCPSTSTCIDMVNAHYCKCPLGKTGESCVRDLDTNYDLYFYLTSKDGYAALPYPIYLSGSSFSLSVWVRFYRSFLTGTFLTIFIAKSANSLAGVTKFLFLDHEGLVVYNKNGQNPQRAAYQQQTVTDGQWNNVMVSWNKDNGFDLVVNSLRQSQIPTTPYTSIMAENIWVTLGADFDSTILPKTNNGFRGHVSQLNIYNRGLSFDDEMPQLILNPQKVFIGSILRWNEFVYHRGVQPVYPSSVQKPCTGANCLAYNKKFPTFKKSCPYDVYRVSTDRLTSVAWTEPIPEGATIQESTYKSGDKFPWGKYTNMYAIRDAANSSTFCSFNIYVMPEQCPNPDPPHLGTRTYERGYYPYFGYTIGCTDANRRIDRHTPKLYTCGPSGAWNPSNRNIPLRFPYCGLVQSHARRRLMMELAYPNISATFCDTLALKLREAFTSVNTRWFNQICGQPDCSNMTVAVNCQATPTTVKMIIPTSKVILTRSSPAETLNVEEILIRSVMESQLLDFLTTIPNGSPDLNSFTIDSSESCPTRQSVVDGYCVKCGPGNFFNSSTLVCEDCPVGTYQDQDDQTFCTPCQQGSTTQTVASPSSSDCKPICSPGHYQTGSRCDPCGVGFYQSQPGMFYCDPCPVGQTTRGDSSTSAFGCDASSSATNEHSDRRDNETVTVYYIIALSCTGMIIILLVTIVLILVRRNQKLIKEMHSLHYVKTVDSSALQQQIDQNNGTQYQELEENHYHYLTPGFENSQL